MQPETKELSAYLYELALSIKAAGQNSAAIEACAERLDAQAALIEQQAAELAILKQRNPNGQRNPSEGDTCGRSCEGQAYRIELRQALARIDELERLNLTFAQNEQQVSYLRGFAQDILECWPHSELDGCDLQDIAETHGILRLEERAEPCGENCACAEYGDFPAECYRKTELLTGQ